MDDRKAIGVIVRAGCSPAPILSGPLRFLRNILALCKNLQGNVEISVENFAQSGRKNPSELSNHHATCAAATPRKSKQK